MKIVNDRGKRTKTPNKVKPFDKKNTNVNNHINLQINCKTMHLSN